LNYAYSICRQRNSCRHLNSNFAEINDPAVVGNDTITGGGRDTIKGNSGHDSLLGEAFLYQAAA